MCSVFQPVWRRLRVVADVIEFKTKQFVCYPVRAFYFKFFKGSFYSTGEVFSQTFFWGTSLNNNSDKRIFLVIIDKAPLCRVRVQGVYKKACSNITCAMGCPSI